MWARHDSNVEPTDYESAALTIELRAQRNVSSALTTILQLAVHIR